MKSLIIAIIGGVFALYMSLASADMTRVSKPGQAQQTQQIQQQEQGK
jgi:hypothetical protein